MTRHAAPLQTALYWQSISRRLIQSDRQPTVSRAIEFMSHANDSDAIGRSATRSGIAQTRNHFWRGSFAEGGTWVFEKNFWTH